LARLLVPRQGAKDNDVHSRCPLRRLLRKLYRTVLGGLLNSK